MGKVVVDIDKWHQNWQRDTNELLTSLFSKMSKNESISLFDTVPEFKKNLEMNPYIYWDPPGSEILALSSPSNNLASVLATNSLSEKIIVPVNTVRDIHTFKELYGFTERTGITFNGFLELIRDGSVKITLTTAPEQYTPDFYQEIFQASMNCSEGSYLPPFPGHIFRNLYEYWPIIQQLNEMKPEDRPTTLPNYPLINLSSWMKKVNDVYKSNPKKIRALDYGGFDIHISELAKRLHNLELYGYADLANISFRIFENDPQLGFDVATLYLNYLTWGFSKGIGAYRVYNQYDMAGLGFLRIRENEEINRLLEISPSDYYIGLNSIPFQILRRVDSMELNSAIKRGPDEEFLKTKYEAQKSFQDYKFEEYVKDCKKINEIITERLNNETLYLYRRSQLIWGLLYHGGQLGATLGIRAVPDEFSLLLKLLLRTPPVQRGFDVGARKLSRYITKKWFFKEKGLPCYLWEYDIINDPNI